jgi:hypothetical protein
MRYVDKRTPREGAGPLPALRLDLGQLPKKERGPATIRQGHLTNKE